MRILLLDIETRPDLAYVWGAYEQNAIAIKEHWSILSYAFKWYGEGGKAEVVALPDFKGYRPGKTDDKALVKTLHALLEQADAIVAHNGMQFDLRKINARFIAHGMPPPSPVKVIDTKREASRVAAFSSNKLDWLCRQLDIGAKIEHEGWAMWEGCIAGDEKDWAKMRKYNLHDIELLEQLFERLKPWMRLPNQSLHSDKGCPSCGQTGKMVKWGTAFLRSRAYQRWRCNACGAYSRDLKNATAKTDRVGL